MIYLVDNYDSFTYNLYQLLAQQTETPIQVIKNDEMTAEQLLAAHPEAVVYSPGPGRPADAGAMSSMIAALAGKVPQFGVCLGMQAMAEYEGAQITPAPVLMHGMTDPMRRVGDSVLLADCPASFPAARYHSLVATDIPQQLTVTAYGSDDSVMAIEDNRLKLYGVQFHPESIMTPEKVGAQILRDFLATIA
ncbi:aminodeoxychorismate/anthranilate synthase component II [Lacticaseibacillus pabuli]|uniref:Aminodeoxychorismate/anthranilate synthase component II n=1 Tax=Lacticaseibacillus pabuli TaxID=3025672 RepID=A0ABY7WST8_9LACO|nr:aminodeoxychorismate/anthranilate synthase component II [Lacticaseibacillus sp. KACC 23028]WDF83191.1 aminodeoxychorismate/anthranilate synthase component II [Lacticaseibacillus sp. KACC 23028]